jgi:ABC-2 type transport system permease protein
MATLTFLLGVWRLNLKAAVSLRGAFLLQTGMMFLNNLLYFTFWWVLFQRFEQIGGWRIADMLVLYSLVASSFGLAVVAGGGVRELGRVILDGGLDGYLTQPKDPLLAVVASRLSASGIGDFVSGILLLALSGKLTFTTAPLALIAIVCGALVFVAAAVLFQAAVFWLGYVASLARQAWEFLIAFSTQPESIFAGPLRVLLFTIMPAGFAGFLPARLVREPSWFAFFGTVGGAVVFTLLAVVVFRRGLRRYASGNQVLVRA